MISHRKWKIRRKDPRHISNLGQSTVLREGWFLFGILLLYARDIQVEFIN